MTDIREQLAQEIQQIRDRKWTFNEVATRSLADIYDEVIAVIRGFRYAADDDCAICNNPRDGRHDDHHYQPRLPPEEWARPTPEQRELMRLEAQRIERERITAPNQEEA